MREKTHKLKWHVLCWISKNFEFIFHLSLASLSLLFKHESLNFVNFSLFLHEVSLFWLEHLYILARLSKPALKVHLIWFKTDIYGWNLSEKVFLMYDDLFSIPLLGIWIISASILSIIALKAPQSSWSSSGLHMFLKIRSRHFGSFG